MNESMFFFANLGGKTKKDEAIIYLLEVNPALALVAMLVSVGVSVVAVRVLLVKVLTRKRFAITPMKEIKNLLKK
jgi:hypothetical protein